MHQDALNQVGNFIDEWASGSFERSPYYYFEPWDVERRSPETIARAVEDGVDLYAEEFVQHVGRDPHPFQSGYMQSSAFFRALIAGTQVGKSRVALVDALIMITGEVPIALRYPKGVDSGVKRMVTRENIIRFGRFKDGLFIDKNPDASGGDWDCGNITGAGVYPQSKIAPPMSELWIGTYMKAMLEYWWPRLYDKDKCIIPSHLIDRTKGANGYSVQDRVIYLVRGGKIAIITYESGYNRFEAEKVHACVLDEEPDNPHIIQSAQQHCRYLSLVETPYRGITYTKDLVFPRKKSPDKVVFHATQYDSPYQDHAQIEVMRQNMKPWDIGARVWGVHSEVSGRPYYDRTKIHLWLQRYVAKYDIVEFVPTEEYFQVATVNYDGKSMKGLMEVPVKMHKRNEEDRCATWRVYEDRQPFVSYVMSIDPAEGSDNPDDAGDTCSAIIMRKASGEEKKPVIVASIRSTLETIQFARVCSHALRYYNNALLAAETRRAACNAVVASELKEYPYWFKMVTIQDSNQKPRTIKGFDPNSATRSAIFDMIHAWLSDFMADEYPYIPDEYLLRELAGCIVGKNNRPDHPRDGTLDTAVCFGILLYVFKHAPEQIVYNGDDTEPGEKKPFSNLTKFMNKGQHGAASPHLGASMPEWR